MWSLRLITPPATELLLVEDAKDHLRVDFDEADDYITGLCLAARITVEEYCSCSFITQGWELGVPRFPWQDGTLLPRGPVQAVNSVIYTDSTLTSHTLVEGTDYLLDLSQDLAEIILNFGTVWRLPCSRQHTRSSSTSPAATATTLPTYRLRSASPRNS
jgi:uncharacterized phiE125 gp8 family phage protein